MIPEKVDNIRAGTRRQTGFLEKTERVSVVWYVELCQWNRKLGSLIQRLPWIPRVRQLGTVRAALPRCLCVVTSLQQSMKLILLKDTQLRYIFGQHQKDVSTPYA